MQDHVPECHGGFVPRGETEEEEALTWLEMRVESQSWRARKVLYWGRAFMRDSSMSLIFCYIRDTVQKLLKMQHPSRISAFSTQSL